MKRILLTLCFTSSLLFAGENAQAAALLGLLMQQKQYRYTQPVIIIQQPQPHVQEGSAAAGACLACSACLCSPCLCCCGTCAVVLAACCKK